MRWVLAGLAFAATVGLAVGTVATRAASVGIRARLSQLEHRVVVQGVENARQVHRARISITRDHLRRLWARWSGEGVRP